MSATGRFSRLVRALILALAYPRGVDMLGGIRGGGQTVAAPVAFVRGNAVGKLRSGGNCKDA